MGQIMAVVTLHKEKVGGGAPIFVAENEQDQQQTAFKLEKKYWMHRRTIYRTAR